MRNLSKFHLMIVAALSVLLSTAAGIQRVAAAPDGSRWGADYIPNFEVSTHDGQRLRFYDDLVKDKMVVINFIYTDCPDICSLSTARLTEVVRRLGDRVGREVFIYSISLDPDNDTPSALAEYAKAFSTPPGWLFITGEAEELAVIRHKLGERSRSLGEHRNSIVLGNDATGEWSRSSVMATYDYLVSNVLTMDPVWRSSAAERQKGQSVSDRALMAKRADTGHVLRDTPGEALFLKACASCHSIGAGDAIGPDLLDVGQRRERDWLVRFLIRPDLMRARKDPIATALDAQYKGVSMPNLSLSTADAGDLLTYIEQRSKALGNTHAQHHDHHNHHDHKHDHGHD